MELKSAWETNASITLPSIATTNTTIYSVTGYSMVHITQVSKDIRHI